MAGYLGHKPKLGKYAVDEFTTSTAQASSGDFVLSQTVTDERSLEVSVGGVDQPTTAYSVSGTTLAFGTNIVAENDIVIARHAGESILYPTLEAGAVTDAKLASSGTMPAWNGAALTGITHTPADNSVTAGKIDLSMTQGDLVYGTGADAWNKLAKGTAAQVLTMNAGATAPEWASAAGGGSDHTAMIGGLTLSRSSGTVLNIATGIARDYGDAVNIDLSPTSFSKNLGYTWAAGGGNGGLDTGSFAANSGYGVYLIRNSSTEVVDVLISLDKTANAATMTKPSGFDQWRLIGWFRTTGSASIMDFRQYGDYFYLQSGNYWEFNDSSITSNSYETVTTTAPPRANCYWHLYRDGTSASGGDSGGFSIRPGDGFGYGNVANATMNFYWNAETAPWGDGMNMFTHCPTDATSRVSYALHSGSPGSEVMRGEILEVNLVTRSHPVAAA